MIYEPSWMAILVFLSFVGLTMGLSFYLGRKAKSSEGYFAAHGQIPWFINGVAFAGDYLSAASFLGICGMIAFYGYDGFLYSIGFLAGWIVALFVVAEPLKRLGKYTFADALNARYQSRGITLVIGISTLVASIFYLIPQMVGAGTLITPLLGLPHWAGVLIVGAVVITIVVTAGMVSTTWVQFLKGSMLVVFSFILTMMILQRGLKVEQGGIDGYKFRTLGPYAAEEVIADDGTTLGPALKDNPDFATYEWEWETQDSVEHPPFLVTGNTFWYLDHAAEGQIIVRECQTFEKKDGKFFVNGLPLGSKKGDPELHPVGYVNRLPNESTATGPLGPVSFLATLQNSEVMIWKKKTSWRRSGMSIFVPTPTLGARILRPGENKKFAGIRSPKFIDKLNFLSLMLALFCGTASLPHILIRYYTVKDEAAARKSTIVGIGTIGVFYILTLYLGLGAMTSGALDLTDDNMAAPLLAKSLSPLLFAIISAIAFTTVLGTVSGLILAAAGAVVHDLLKNYMQVELNDSQSVRVAKITSVVVGAIAVVLGILFKEMNVGALVGWAFSIAASANLPSLIMLLFWKRTTREGIIAGVVVGMVTSLAWILSSGATITGVYGIAGHPGYVPFSEPGIVTIPLGFLTVIGVSLLTKPHIDGVKTAP